MGQINAKLLEAIYGRPSGNVGALNLQPVRVEDLAKSISAAEAPGVAAGADAGALRLMVRLVRSARGLFELRSVLLEGKIESYAESHLLTSKYIDQAVPEARNEFLMIRDEIFNGSIARTLRAALKHGGPYESGGALTERAPGASIDKRGVETEALQSALVAARSKSFGEYSEEVHLLIRTQR